MRSMKSRIYRYGRRRARREFNRTYRSYTKSKGTYTNNVKNEVSENDVLIGMGVLIGILFLIGIVCNIGN